jgi:hypothetical protein
MPTIGDPSRFAVEYALNANHGGAWLFGQFCYWCGGDRVGDFELGTSLRDVLFELDEFAKGRGRRSNARFASMPANDVFRTLDGAMFGAPLSTPDAADLAIEEQWGHHIVRPRVDVLDRWTVYLVEHDGRGRLLVSTAPYHDIREVVLAAGEVDAVIDSVRLALDAMYNREVGPEA